MTQRHAPATLRNRDPIAHVLELVLPDRGMVLEIASGTGEHASYFARRFPDLQWQPSDPDPDAIASIAAWREEAGADNLLPPLQIDAAAPEWPVERADAILCVNMVHISAWEATAGLFRNARKLLAGAGPLIIYGPFLEDGTETALSNLEFDRSLKSRNHDWGLRDTGDLDRLADENGMRRVSRFEMPANNLTLVFS